MTLSDSLRRVIRWQPGSVKRSRHGLIISDDDDGVLADVIHLAVMSPEHDVTKLCKALHPGGSEFSTSDGSYAITWLEEPGDLPWCSPEVTSADLAESELWQVSIDRPGGRGRHVVIEGNALRDLVRRAGEVLGRT